MTGAGAAPTTTTKAPPLPNPPPPPNQLRRRADNDDQRPHDPARDLVTGAGSEWDDAQPNPPPQPTRPDGLVMGAGAGRQHPS